MDRKIAFRAWDVENNRMMNAIFIGLGKVYGMTKTFKPAKQLENVILMQYTGLKDKNGKEIYEGDIVRYRYMNNIPYRIAQIRILGGGTTPNALETKIDTTDGYIYPLSNELEFPITKSEIIGNIYENPELLTKD